ncbi:MAG: hypothetical protein SGBAC_010124 [Bacillariaceae sp.]
MREIMQQAFPQDLPASSRRRGVTSPSPERYHVAMPNQVSRADREDLFLYFNVLALEETTNLDPSTVAIYCSVTLLNVAIMYHMEGISQGRMRFMEQARKMYEASLHMLNSQDNILENDTVLLVQLAASNNLAHIELEKGMVDVANERLSHLYALLQATKSRALGIISCTELRGLFLNSSLQRKSCAASAA